jgi:diguanylate cyclase (GGDEF)-like protein
MIKSISDIIRNNARGNDTIFRFGGDEFILLIYNIDRKTSEFVWRRIENNFNAFNEKSGKQFTLSAAHGFAEYDPIINQSPEELIKLADSEMYINKKEMKAER